MDERGGGYIWVGKEAGRKRAGRHGEVKISISFKREEKEAADA
jgi:hypothetical protein